MTEKIRNRQKEPDKTWTPARLVKALRSDDNFVSDKAETLLLEMGARGITALLKALEGHDPYTRFSAADTLRLVGHDQATRTFIELLGEEDSDLKDFSKVALGRVGEAALPFLFEAFSNSDNTAVRSQIILAIGEVRSEKPLPLLLEILADWQAEVSLKVSAANALASIRSKKAVDNLLQIIGEATVELKIAVIWALGLTKDKKAVEPLLQTLVDPDARIRARAVYALSGFPSKRVLKALIKLLEDPSRDVRWQVVRALASKKYDFSARLIDSEVTLAVVNAFFDPSIQVQIESFAIARKFSNKFPVQPLIHLLNDTNGQVAGSAAETLAAFDPGRVYKPLVEALTNKNPIVQVSAVLALGNLGDKRAVEPIIKLLNNKNFKYPNTAAVALGNLGDRMAIEPLAGLLRETDNATRFYAAEALSRFKDERAIKVLIETLEVLNTSMRREAVRALGQFNSPTVKVALEEALKDPNFHVRDEALEILERVF